MAGAAVAAAAFPSGDRNNWQQQAPLS